MNEIKISQFFKENGYVILRNVLSSDEVKQLRSHCEDLLIKKRTTILTPTEFIEDQCLNYIYFQDKVVSFLKNIFESDYFVTPTFTVRKNLFISWHTDDQMLRDKFEEPSGVAEISQATIYLQDNLSETGGGLDIVPCSHKLTIEKKQALIEEGAINNFVSIDTKAGDLFVFDYRLIHRGSVPKNKEQLDGRLAIQCFVARTKELTKNLIEYQLSRRYRKLHLADKGANDLRRFYFDIPNIVYPDAFDSALVEQIEKNKVFIL